MLSDRNWEVWCAREFTARMQAKGKMSATKNEALQRKEQAYFETYNRIFPKSCLYTHRIVKETTQQRSERKALKIRVRRLEEACHAEKEAREQAHAELKRLQTTSM